MNKQDIVIGGIILFLLCAGGYAVFKVNKKTTPASETSSTTQVTQVTNKPSKPPVSPTQKAMLMQQDLHALEERLAADPNSKKIELKDITGGQASGVSYILREDGKLFNTINAKLDDLKEGYVYEGWIVKEVPRRTYISTGKLRKLPDNSFILTANADGTYEDYTTVLVTREAKVDDKPEVILLEGKVSP